MKDYDIILWTFSLILAVTGIVFGVIASFQSSRANNKLSTMISNTWIAEESQKYFFDNIQELIVNNKKIISKLKKEITFFEYSTSTTLTRMVPQSLKFIKFVNESEFKDLSAKYKDMKTTLDTKFKDIFIENNLNINDILNSDEIITHEFKKILVEFHNIVIDSATKILVAYDQLTN